MEFPWFSCFSTVLTLLALACYAAPFASAQTVLIPLNPALHVERHGHTATPLADGTIFIAGGESAAGPTDQSESYDPMTQTLSIGPLSLVARADHTATLLGDGRILVIGGRDANGKLSSTEMYDPVAGAFSAGPDLNVARAGHSATVLQDGRVLVAGGDSAATAEVYDPGTGQFTLLGAKLGTPRAFHGAALLKNGTVLLAGGSGGLSSAELYSPATGAFAPVANGLAVGRVRPTLRVLPDGKVQVIGGASDRSIEVYDPVDNSFGAHAKVLNGSNTAGDVLNTQTRAALLYKGSTLVPALDELLNRGNYSLTELPQRNEALVGGGVDSGNQILNSAYVLGSSQASVTTDKLDYAPFETVTFSGAGWQPGETVEMILHEEPNTGPDIPLSVQADNQGKFTFDAFAPDEGDVGVTFTLTAWGLSSGYTAQTAFTDARNWVLTFAGTGSGSVTITVSTGTVNAPISCGGTGTAVSSQTVTSTCLPNITTSANGATVTFNATAGSGSTFAGWSNPSSLSSSTCSGTTNPCSAVLGSGAALTVTFNAVANTAPVLGAIGSKTVDEGTELTFTASATDADVPANTLTFSLVGAPSGASINGSTGVFSWTPTEAQGPGDYPFTVKVCDNGSPSLCDDEAVSVHVNEVNQAPVLGAIGNKTVDEGTALSFTASATDADIPANTLTFSLVGAPIGASINGSSGAFSWTPPDNGSFAFTVTVCDNGSPVLCDGEEITVTVKNVAPTVTGLVAGAAAACGGINALTINFSDPAGIYDTYSATIDWGDGSDAQTFNNNISSGDTFNHAYALAGQYTASVTVSDEDGGMSTSASATLTLNLTLVGGGILPPVNPGPPWSIFKYKSTIPVKIKVQDCNGSYPNTLGPQIAVQKYTGSTPSGIDEGIYSTSAGDTGTTMRFTGSPDYQYLYNLATKSLTDPSAGYQITITIPLTSQKVTANIGLKP